MFVAKKVWGACVGDIRALGFSVAGRLMARWLGGEGWGSSHRPANVVVAQWLTTVPSPTPPLDDEQLATDQEQMQLRQLRDRRRERRWPHR